MTRGREVAPEDLLLACIPSSLAIRTGSGFWGGRLPQQHSLASIFCCSRGCWERMKWLGQGFRTASALFYALSLPAHGTLRVTSTGNADTAQCHVPQHHLHIGSS